MPPPLCELEVSLDVRPEPALANDGCFASKH
jgi:hypothetical protein